MADDPPGPSTFSFKIVSGKVPPGLSFEKNTLPARPEARVVGTPTTVGTSSFTVEVKDNTGATARRTFTITVGPRLPLVITNLGDELFPGTVGQTYGFTVFADKGTKPYTWALIGGALPPGLTLTRATGVIDGAPTAAGIFSFTAQVTDAAGATASRTFSITVTAT